MSSVPVPPSHGPADLGYSLAVSTAILGVLLIIADQDFPNLLWFHRLDYSISISALIVVLAVAIASMITRRKLAELTISAVIAIITYSVVLGGTVLVQQSAYRSAESSGDAWATLITQNYEDVTAWLPDSSNDSEFGHLESHIRDGVFTVTVDSNRDETGLIAPDGNNMPAVSDFFVEVDVNLVQGPSDGYCLVAFGLTESEHWWAFKIGDERFEVTQNRGGLPHHVIEGPVQYDPLRKGSPQRVSILKQGDQLSAFVDGFRVAELSGLDIPTGTIWLAPQAPNTPNLVTCAFDNFTLKGQH